MRRTLIGIARLVCCIVICLCPALPAQGLARQEGSTLAPPSLISDPQSDTNNVARTAGLFREKYRATTSADFARTRSQLTFLETALKENGHWQGRIPTQALQQLLDLTVLSEYQRYPDICQAITDYFAQLPQIVSMTDVAVGDSTAVGWRALQEEISLVIALHFAKSENMSDIVAVLDFMCARQDPRITGPFIQLVLDWTPSIQGPAFQWLVSHGHTKELLPRLVQQLAQKGYIQSANAKLYLIKLGDTNAVRAVVPLLVDPNVSEDIRQRAHDVLFEIKASGRAELVKQFIAAPMAQKKFFLEFYEQWNDALHGPLDPHLFVPLFLIQQENPSEYPQLANSASHLMMRRTSGNTQLHAMGEGIDTGVLTSFIKAMVSKDLSGLVSPFLLRVRSVSHDDIDLPALLNRITEAISTAQWGGLLNDFQASPNPMFRELLAGILDACRPFTPSDIPMCFNTQGHGKNILPYLAMAPVTFMDIAAIRRNHDLSSAGTVASIAAHFKQLELVLGHDLIKLLLDKRRLSGVVEVQNVRAQVPVLIGDNFSLRVPAGMEVALKGIPGLRFGPKQVVFTQMHFDPETPLDTELRTKMDLLDELRRINDQAYALIVNEVGGSREPFDSPEIQKCRKRIRRNLEEMIDRHYDIYRDAPTRDHLQTRLALIDEHLSTKRDITELEEQMNVDKVSTFHTFLRYLHKISVEGFFEINKPGAGQWEQPSHIVTGILDTQGQEVLVTHPVRIGDNTKEYSEPLRYTSDLLMDTVGIGQKPASYQILVAGNRVLLFKEILKHKTEMMIDFSHPDDGGMVQVHWNDNVDYTGENETEGGITIGDADADTHDYLSLRQINDVRRSLLRRVLGDLKFHVRVPTADTVMPFDGVSPKAPDTALHARFDKDSGASYTRDIYRAAKTTLEMLSATPRLDTHILITYRDMSSEILGEKFVTLMADFLNRMGVVEFRRVVESETLKFENQIKALDGPGPAIRQRLNALLKQLGQVALPSEEEQPLGQPLMDMVLREPLTVALNEKRIARAADGSLHKNPTYKRLTRLEVLVDTLLGDDTFDQAILEGRILRRIKPRLKFVAMGSINGYLVQKADFYIRGRLMTVFALLDAQGEIVLGGANWGRFIHELKDPETGGHCTNLIQDVDELRNVIVPAFPGIQIPENVVHADALRLERQKTRDMLARPIPRTRIEERRGAVVAVPLSPGSSSGRIVFKSSPKTDIPLEKAILVGERIMPEDESVMEKCRAIAVTGGSPLAHAAIVAREIGLPGVVVEGRWGTDREGPFLEVQYEAFETYARSYQGYHLLGRKGLQQKKTRLREGRVAVVDGNEGRLYLLSFEPKEQAEIQKIFEAIVDYKKSPERETFERLMSHITAQTTYREAAFLLNEAAFSRNKLPLEERQAVFQRTMAQLGETVKGEIAQQRNLIRDQAMAELLSFMEQATTRMRENAHSPFQALYLLSEFEKKMHLLWDLETMMGLAHNDFSTQITPLIDAFTLRKQQFFADVEKKATELMNGKRPALEIAAVLKMTEMLGVSSPVTEALNQYDNQLRDQAKRANANRWTIPFPAAQKDYESRYLGEFVGGKGAALGTLSGIARIPVGFRITVKAFQAFLDNNHITIEGRTQSLKDWIQEISGQNLPTEEESKNIQDLILRGSFDAIPELRDEILNNYRTIMGNAAVAVRSSSAHEDTEQSSFAGQFESHLNVHEENLLTEIKTIWASFWTDRAIQYRKFRELPLDYSHAVVVQKMVGEARVSGVLMSADRRDNNPDRIEIAAGYGLGEGPIGGETDADLFVINRNDLGLVDEHIADKQRAVVASLGGGTEIIRVIGRARTTACLTDNELKELAQTALRIEALSGIPIYMEFAINEDGISCLQARPITTFLGDIRHTLAQLHPNEILKRLDETSDLRLNSGLNRRESTTVALDTAA